jgi:hypothetical protein
MMEGTMYKGKKKGNECVGMRTCNDAKYGEGDEGCDVWSKGATCGDEACSRSMQGWRYLP